MKWKPLVIACAVLIGFSQLLKAGLQVSVSLGNCHPYPIYFPSCLVVYGTPFVYTPVFYYGAPVVSYEKRFSNLAPFITSDSPVEKISAPYIVADPLIVYEGSRFRWKK